MNPDPRVDPNLTLETVDRVEEICTIFEGNWRKGERLAIEDMLGGVDGFERSFLLRELLAVELESRLLAGERPMPAEYIERFPGNREIVELAFREAEQTARNNEHRLHEKASPAWIDRQHARTFPCVFGDYELREEIARGGMGVVFKALQLSLNRIVAVKMILAGQLASDAEVERFYVEAQAAAQLNHPGIVPIYEVGQWQGQRYFSMAFIDGASLANRIAKGSLPPREAAQLICSVALAVQYAHDRGIIHRDLKPANILLDAGGHPHVTDFGLAKRVGNDDGLTAPGQLVGTPSFMPPEQAVGKVDLIGPASDVYSLGAVLYAALTGRPPFQAASTLDTLKQVSDQEPVAPRRLDAALPRDLDTIVLRCLAKAPARRYASPRELAEELQRFLSGKPILARPIGASGRAYRWCLRNPLVSSLTALIAALFIAITVSSAIVAWRMNALRNDAVEQHNAANANLVRAESERKNAEQNLELAHQMIRQLAKSYNLLGDQQKRFDDRLQWYEKAHSLLDQVAGEAAASSEVQAELVGSLSRLGMLHAGAGRVHQAVKAFDQAVEMLDSLCRQHPERTDYQASLAKVCDFLGRQHRLDNRLDAAVAMFRKACGYQEQLVAMGDTGSIESRRNLALYYADLGATQRDMDQIAASESSLEQARRWLEPIAEQNPSDNDLQLELASIYRQIGMHWTSKDPMQWLTRSRGMLEAVVRQEPHEPRYRSELARILSAIARREDSPLRAISWQRQALDLWDRLSDELPNDPIIQVSAVNAEREAAGFLKLVGRHREALANLARSLDRISILAATDTFERCADIEVQILALLARGELQLANSDAYRAHCRAIVSRCRRRNCYEYDALRVCLLEPDAIDDREELVALVKDATTRGSRTLRKRANLGGALYRAGHYQEAIRSLKAVYESNRMVLAVGIGTAEVARADNARVAVFSALAHNCLGNKEESLAWLAKAEEWMNREGRAFAIRPTDDRTETETEDGPSALVFNASAFESSDSTLQAGKQEARRVELEDRTLLADITFEVELLLDQAKQLIGLSPTLDPETAAAD